MNITKKLLFLLTLLLFIKVSAQDTISTDRIYQLREYTLLPQHKDIFHSNFTNHTLLTMKGYGFNILSTWINGNNFYYLLQWDNTDTMYKQWELFRSDKEWINKKNQIKEQYGEVVQEINEQVLTNMYFQNNQSKLANNGFPTFKIGNIECIMLSDGFVSLPAQPSIAPQKYYIGKYRLFICKRSCR